MKMKKMKMKIFGMSYTTSIMNAMKSLHESNGIYPCSLIALVHHGITLFGINIKKGDTELCFGNTNTLV